MTWKTAHRLGRQAAEFLLDEIIGAEMATEIHNSSWDEGREEWREGWIEEEIWMAAYVSVYVWQPVPRQPS